MDLIDEEDVAVLQVGQHGGERTLVLDCWTRRGPDIDPHLVRHDVRQRGFAQARWSGDHDVLDRLVPAFGRLDQDLQIRLDRLLPDELAQMAGAKAAVELLVLGPFLAGDDAIGHPRSSPLRAIVTSCSTEWLPPLPTVTCRTASFASAGV